MRKTKFLFGVLAALCFMAFTASSASAFGVSGAAPFPNFTGSNTGPAVGAHTFTIAGGGLVVTCTTVNNSGTSPAAPVDTHGHRTTASFTMAYTGCTTNLGGPVIPTTVTVNCAWTATINNPTNIFTGASPWTSNGTLSTNCNTTISLNGTACVVTVPPTTKAINGQNYNAAGTAPAVTGSLVITAAITGVNWTQTGCPIPPSGADGTYSGKKWERNIWVVI